MIFTCLNYCYLKASQVAHSTYFSFRRKKPSLCYKKIT